MSILNLISHVLSFALGQSKILYHIRGVKTEFRLNGNKR